MTRFNELYNHHVIYKWRGIIFRLDKYTHIEWIKGIKY